MRIDMAFVDLFRKANQYYRIILGLIVLLVLLLLLSGWIEPFFDSILTKLLGG